jgi:uncharacterized RDD family membrane protein YckC
MEEVRNPYAVPQAQLEPPFQSREWVKANRGTRLAAHLMDVVLYGLCFGPGYVQLSLAGQQDPIAYGPLGTVTSVLCALAGLALFAYNLWLLHERGQTLGKLWLNIRIVRCDGSRAGLARLFWLRSFVPALIGAIPCLGAMFHLADAVAIFDEDKRCVHDFIADTIVVGA